VGLGHPKLKLPGFEAGGLTPVFTLNTACRWFTLFPEYRLVSKRAELIGVEGLFRSILSWLRGS